MKIPGFTAEASLYNMSGHHRVCNRVINSHRRQIINAVQPALQREERIEIFDCGPGFIGIGEGANLECFPNPLTEPSRPREPREPREHREPRETRGPRITSRPGRPWPEETPRPLPPCNSSLQKKWYDIIGSCLRHKKTDLVGLMTCLSVNGCSNANYHLCRVLCPEANYQNKPLTAQEKKECQEFANKFIKQTGKCQIPIQQQRMHIKTWV